jgi:Zn-dependent protease
MSTKARVVLTVAAGIVMGVSLWLGAGWGYAFYASVVLLPLIVGRWWVVAALAGPFIASVALDLTGHMSESGSDDPEFGFIFVVFFLVFLGFLMLILVGIRKAFDFLRKRRLIATS